jgi:hypothetical protein
MIEQVCMNTIGVMMTVTVCVALIGVSIRLVYWIVDIITKKDELNRY